jgi:hypothetical protein
MALRLGGLRKTVVNFKPTRLPGLVREVYQFRRDFGARHESPLILATRTGLVDDVWTVADPRKGIVGAVDLLGELVHSNLEKGALVCRRILHHDDDILTIFDKVSGVGANTILVVQNDEFVVGASLDIGDIARFGVGKLGSVVSGTLDEALRSIEDAVVSGR